MTTGIDLPDWVTSVNGPTAVVFDDFGGSGHIPVAPYQSVLVQLFNNDGTTRLVARYKFFDAAGNVLDSGLLSANTTSGTPTWTLPVLGASFQLVSGVGAGLGATVTGVPVRLGKRTGMDYLPLRKFQVTVPSGAANGTATPMPGVTISLDAQFPDLSSDNGPVLYVFSVSALGGATSWRALANVARLDGSIDSEAILTVSAATPLTVLGGHPSGYVSWSAQNIGATTAAVIVTLLVVPAGNG